MEASAALPADPRSVGDARHFAARTLRDWRLVDLVDRVELLVSELATNAVLHARTPLTVRLRRGSGEISLYVCDESPAPPLLRRFSVESATGRGLRLVASLAAAWGVESDGTGKCVWCTVPLDAHLEPEPDALLAAFEAFDLDLVDEL